MALGRRSQASSEGDAGSCWQVSAGLLRCFVLVPLASSFALDDGWIFICSLMFAQNELRPRVQGQLRARHGAAGSTSAFTAGMRPGEVTLRAPAAGRMHGPVPLTALPSLPTLCTQRLLHAGRAVPGEEWEPHPSPGGIFLPRLSAGNFCCFGKGAKTPTVTSSIGAHDQGFKPCGKPRCDGNLSCYLYFGTSFLF